MAMPVRIVMYAPDAARAQAAARAAFDRVATLEATMSDYRAQSELRRLADSAGRWASVSEPLFDLLSLSATVARLTNGAFDPTVGPVVALWREARKNGQLPDSSRLRAAHAAVGWRKIRLDSAARRVFIEPGVSIDLGGIAKGYILQQAVGVFREAGLPQAMLVAGGDIVAGEPPPGAEGWTIDVPNSSSDFGKLASTLLNAALATSGPSAQFMEVDGVRYSHVVDPRTGFAITNALMARVVARDAAIADALATALTVLNDAEREEVLRRFPGVVIETFGSATAQRP